MSIEPSNTNDAGVRPRAVPLSRVRFMVGLLCALVFLSAWALGVWTHSSALLGSAATLVVFVSLPILGAAATGAWLSARRTTAHVVARCADAEDRARMQTLRLELLNTIANGVSDGRSSGELVRMTLEGLRTMTGWRACFCEVAGESFRVLECEAPSGRREVMGLKVDVSRAPAFRDALLSGTPFICVDVRESEALAPIMDTVLEAGTGAVLDAQVRLVDGRQSLLCLSTEGPQDWTREEIEVVSEVAGALAGAFARVEEAEQRQRAEAMLRLTQQTVDQAGEAVYWLGRRGEFLYVNESACEALGYSREQLLTMSLPQIDDAVTDPADDAAWESFRGLGSWRIESRHRRSDGTTFPVEINATYTTYQGHEMVVAFARDISARIAAEESLRSYAQDLIRTKEALEAKSSESIARAAELERLRTEAERASRVKSEFLANMSHEIRTPMTSILGYAELLESASLPDGERALCVETIRRSGEHLLDMINEILDVSKIEAGKMTVERIDCSCERVVGDAVAMVAPRAQEKGLELVTEIGDDVPPMLVTDPTRLRQILTNLLGNAVKFTSSGAVRVRVSRADCDHDACVCVRFDVTDTGIGIAPNQLGTLFEPFAQVDSSMSRRYGGTGLGLAISRRLARMLGGDLTVASSPGAGSTFSLTITAAPSSEARREREADGATGSAPESMRLTGRVLLVEDNPDTQRLLAFHLRRAGAEVVPAGNGAEAVELAMRAWNGAPGDRFDLILMDVQMPLLDGHDAVVRLRRMGYGGAIVALTAHSSDEDESRAMEAGCDGYMCKPIRAVPFLEGCARAMGRDLGRAGEAA